MDQTMFIGELAQRTGTTPRALRYYEEQNLLTSVRLPNGYREYDEEAVHTVWRIRGLLEAGFSAEAITTILPCTRGDQGEKPSVELCPEVATEMRRTLASIERRMDALAQHQHAVSALLDSSLP